MNKNAKDIMSHIISKYEFKISDKEVIKLKGIKRILYFLTIPIFILNKWSNPFIKSLKSPYINLNKIIDSTNHSTEYNLEINYIKSSNQMKIYLYSCECQKSDFKFIYDTKYICFTFRSLKSSIEKVDNLFSKVDDFKYIIRDEKLNSIINS